MATQSQLSLTLYATPTLSLRLCLPRILCISSKCSSCVLLFSALCIMTPRESPNILGAKNKTSELDSGFFRAWSLRPSARSARSSDTVQTNDVSPGTIPVPASIVSTSSKAQRYGKRPDVQRLRSSQASERLSDQGIPADTVLQEPVHGYTPDDEPALLSRTSLGSLGLESNHPRPSSPGSPFRRLVTLSSHGLAPPNKDTKPSQKTGDGLKWNFATSGHWIEFKVGRKSRADEANRMQDDGPLQSIPQTPLTPLASSRLSKAPPSPSGNREQYSRESVAQTKGPSAGRFRGSARSHPVTPATPKAKSRWTRRRSVRKQGVDIQSIQSHIGISPARSLTGHLLQRASSVLRNLADNKLSPPSSASSNLSIAASYSRNKRLSPLYRGHSVNSSMGNMHGGKGPAGTPATPDSELMYLGSNAERYYRVEISDPGGPTYLPSEARRIGTPPLPGEDGRRRGFFFDYNVPSPDDDESTTPSRHLRPRLEKKGPLKGDWYLAKLEADEARDTTSHFDFNVPDHLPSSPLCPKNPKHKSGGKGICVYHGRNRDPENATRAYTLR